MSYRYSTSFSMGSLSPVVRNLIIVSSVLFILDEISRSVLNSHLGILTFYLGLLPVAVTKSWWVWQLATYLFIHGNLWHLLFNMLALWMFGSPIERVWGGRRFLKYFFATGVGAGIASTLLATYSGYIVGSSGAIYGILVAFAIMFPDAELLVFFIFPMKARHYCILFGAIELYFSLSTPGSTIAHMAHLGGMVVGYLILRPPHFFKKPRRLSLVVSKQKPSTQPYVEEDLQKKVDIVLDKIRMHGMNSLSPDERKILEAASARLKNKPDQNS